MPSMSVDAGSQGSEDEDKSDEAVGGRRARRRHTKSVDAQEWNRIDKGDCMAREEIGGMRIPRDR